MSQSTSMQILAVGAGFASGKDPKDLTAREIKNHMIQEGFLAEKDRLDAVGKMEKQLTVVYDKMWSMRIDKVKEANDYLEGRYRILDRLDNYKGGEAELKSLVADLRKTDGQQEKLLERLDDYDWKMIDAVVDKSMKPQGGNQAKAIFHALTRDDVFADGSRIVDMDDYKKVNTIGHALKLVNEAMGEGNEVFEFDNEQNMLLTNLEALKQPDGPLRGLGFSDSEIESSVFRNAFNVLDQYQLRRGEMVGALEEIDLENKDTRALVDMLEAENDPAKRMEIRAQIAGGMRELDEILRKGSTLELDDLEQYREEIKIYGGLEASAKRLERGIKALDTDNNPATVSPQERQLFSEMETIVASPVIREWAADHGFDEIGSLDYDEKGRPIPGTYIRGRDDAALIRAHQREYNRGAGRYGFRSIGTGDTVQFTRDGETFVGERLKYHAADRGGTIRVAVPGIDEPVLISPKDNIRVILLKRDPDKLSPLARRAKGLLRRKNEEIESLTQRFDFPDRSESVAKTKDGKFIVEKETGRYIDQADYDELLSAKLAENQFKGVYVGGKPYALAPDGLVYSLDGGQPVEVHDKDIHEALLQVPARPIIGETGVDEDGEPIYAPLTTENFNTDAILGYGISSLESDDDYDPNDGVLFPAMAEQSRSLAFEALNFETTDDPYDRFRGRTKNERNIGGIRFVELNEDPEAIEDYNEDEEALADEQNRPPVPVQPMDDAKEAEVELATDKEAVDAAPVEDKPAAKRAADMTEQEVASKVEDAELAIALSRGETRGVALDKPKEKPPGELEPWEPLPGAWTPPTAGPLADLTEMDDDEAKARVEGTYEEPKPGASEIEGSGGLLAGVPSAIGTRREQVLRGKERKAGKEPTPIDLPKLKRGSYKGRGGYEYQVSDNGDIKITKSPKGRGVGTVLKSGSEKDHTAYAAITNELAKGPGPKEPDMDLSDIDIDAIVESPPPAVPEPKVPAEPVKIAGDVESKRQQIQKTFDEIRGAKPRESFDPAVMDMLETSTEGDVDEVTQAAGTPGSVIAPGRTGTPDPNDLSKKLLEGARV